MKLGVATNHGQMGLKGSALGRVEALLKKLADNGSTPILRGWRPFADPGRVDGPFAAVKDPGLAATC